MNSKGAHNYRGRNIGIGKIRFAMLVQNIWEGVGGSHCPERKGQCCTSRCKVRAFFREQAVNTTKVYCTLYLGVLYILGVRHTTLYTCDKG